MLFESKGLDNEYREEGGTERRGDEEAAEVLSV